jgi:hypothetical protein
MPNYAWWDRQNYKTGRKVPDGFTYTSNSNDEWLSVEDLRKIIHEPSPAEMDPTGKLVTTIHRLSEKTIMQMLNSEEIIPEIKKKVSG